ncbi:MAG: hypothetical protein KAR00_03095 [Candidatus Pacebacteria bacterium]|nr:hypothetical protein [Candidatus Paceibacterota bacterium]
MKKALALFAVLALVVAAVPAEASWWWWGSNDITVNNNSSATVSNTVTTVADTGANDANGGDARSRAYGRGADSYARGGNGGDIDTGNADATAYVGNYVNSNDTRVVTDCGCTGDVTVNNNSSAGVYNTVDTLALTGGNIADGGDANSKAKSSSYGYYHYHGGSSADSDAFGGSGGFVETGNADSYSDVVNVVNQNVTRVIR